MIRPIVAYGDPILKKKAIEIDIDEPGELKSLIKDLWDTMSVSYTHLTLPTIYSV